MLKKIRITPIAAESLGVRSMCTMVETPDVKILLDAGLSVSPYRFNLMPHPKEFLTISKLRKKIEEAAKKVDIVTISHYHFDHHTPSHEDWIVNWTCSNLAAQKIYNGQLVLVKSPYENITQRQKNRALIFEKKNYNTASKIEIADDKTYIFGKSTTLKFSKAVSHGPGDNTLGWVILLLIKYKNEKFLFAPDIQGPMCYDTMKLILEYDPDIILLGGPPFYQSNYKVDILKIKNALQNLEKIVKQIPIIIMEHHALRDKNWKIKSERLFRIADRHENKIITAAEFLSVTNKLYEANRKELYFNSPPSKEFLQWVEKVKDKKINLKPPL